MSSQAKPKQERWHRGTEKRTCEICGVTYTAMAPHQTICMSVACKQQQQKAIYEKQKDKYKAGIKKQCSVCGKAFTTNDRRRLNCGCSPRKDGHIDPKVREMSDTNVEIIYWSMQEKGMTFRQAAELAGWGNKTDIAERRLLEKGYKVTTDGIERIQEVG